MASNNILIVDDDPIVLRMLESALSKNGYHTFKAESARMHLGFWTLWPLTWFSYMWSYPGWTD